jgi:hypothetical protein
MIESPVLQELKAEWTREAAREAALETTRGTIIEVLVARFGPEAQQLRAELEVIKDGTALRELVKRAAVCSNLDSFKQELARRRTVINEEEATS